MKTQGESPARTARTDSGTQANGRGRWLLVVDDNPAEVDLVCEALGDEPTRPEVRIARTGGEALRLLRQVADGDLRAPGFVLLDLNLPGIDGHLVLSAMRADAQLCHLPVVVFSGSSAPEDVLAAYRAGANCYLTKPIGLARYRRAVRSLEHFWMDVATLPALP